MLREKLSFVVSYRSDQSVQLGIAEPAGLDITGSPTFSDRKSLEVALEQTGLPAEIASEIGFTQPMRVSFLQLVSLCFF